MVRSNPDRWREVALLAGAKAARGTAASLWLLVEALCLNEPDGVTEPADVWGAQIAAQALVETADLSRVGKAHQAKLKRAIHWLTRFLDAEQLPVTERALAGDNLAKLSDPRPGVSVKEGLPDFQWVCIPGTAAVRISGHFPGFTGLRLGNGAKPDPEARDDEIWPVSAEPLELQAFELAVHPVTVAQFRPLTTYQFLMTSPLKAGKG